MAGNTDDGRDVPVTISIGGLGTLPLLRGQRRQLYAGGYKASPGCASKGTRDLAAKKLGRLGKKLPELLPARPWVFFLENAYILLGK